jgi:hypothetical protein
MVSLQDEKHCNGLQWLDGSGFHFDQLDVSVVVGVVSKCWLYLTKAVGGVE